MDKDVNEAEKLVRKIPGEGSPSRGTSKCEEPEVVAWGTMPVNSRGSHCGC